MFFLIAPNVEVQVTGFLTYHSFRGRGLLDPVSVLLV